ncbi:hypothetical protein ACFSCX_06195 [Bacillus salitolerans]|uniref:Uncharacterized protein n=1 Tax=Bacillus salitolerans TaxID=1437434 RepID=A0ABW4LNQ4_9BACI
MTKSKLQDFTVQLTLKPIQVLVQAEEGTSDQEIVTLAKQKALQVLSEKFPSITYIITKGESLTLQDAYPGQVIREKDAQKVGVITEVKPRSKFPIEVTHVDGKQMKYIPSTLEKSNNEKDFESVMNIGRPSYYGDSWAEGCTGWFVNGKELIPVVIGKVTTAYYYVHTVGLEGKNSHYKLKTPHMARVFPNKEDALKFLKN